MKKNREILLRIPIKTDIKISQSLLKLVEANAVSIGYSKQDFIRDCIEARVLRIEEGLEPIV